MKGITVAAAVSAALVLWGCDSNGIDPIHEDVDAAIIATFHQECSSCHQWQRVYRVTFASVDQAWSLVEHMVDNGANLSQVEVMALAEYLYELRGGGEDG